QGEEGGLEGVLRVLPVGQQPPADAQDHPAVAAQQLLEGGLVAPRREAGQEVAVRRLAVPGGELTDLPQQELGWFVEHGGAVRGDSGWSIRNSHPGPAGWLNNLLARSLSGFVWAVGLSCHLDPLRGE